MTAPTDPLVDAFTRRYRALLGDTLPPADIERLLLHVFLLSSDDLILSVAHTLQSELTESHPLRRCR